MADESGERIPLTIADFDRTAGTITLVVMVVAAQFAEDLAAGRRRASLRPDRPAGQGVGDRDRCDTVVMVAGGVGTRPIYPDRPGVPRGRHAASSRSREPGRRNCCSGPIGWPRSATEHIITTDDGTRRPQGAGDRAAARSCWQQDADKRDRLRLRHRPGRHDEVLLPRPRGRSASRRWSA